MNMQTPRLSMNDVFELLQKKNPQPGAQAHGYHAMYSSWMGGIVTDAAFMLLPLDDHMVHRGDGVFEAIKIVNGGIYLLEEHLERLFLSAEKIQLGKNFNKSQLKEIILQTALVGIEMMQKKNPTLKRGDAAAIIRLFLSRGPGSFSPSPYDTIGNQFHCVITDFKPLAAEKYERGVSLGKSQVAVKQNWFPTVKSCNYLPNVLMKKESVDRGLDFTVNYNSEGFLAESATENVFIIDRQSQMLHPRLDYILKGTMMLRAFELAQQQDLLKVVGTADIGEADLLAAQGVFMAGTTLDVIPVTQYESKKIPIPAIYQKLLTALKEDQKPGSSKWTAI